MQRFSRDSSIKNLKNLAVAMAMATAAAISARHGVYQVGGRYGYYDYPSNGDYFYQEDESGSVSKDLTRYKEYSKILENKFGND